MKEFELRAGERTKVLSIFSDSISQKIKFEVLNTDNTAPSGLVEIETSLLPMMKVNKVKHPLLAANSLQKTRLQTNLAVYVTSNANAVLHFKTRHFRSKLFWAVLALVAVSGLVAALIPLLMRS